jgi:hypothetical protein
MLILKYFKTLQHVSIIIQIIFRELVCYILKSLNLKICYEYTHTHTHTHTNTTNVMLPHHHI